MLLFRAMVICWEEMLTKEYLVHCLIIANIGLITFPLSLRNLLKIFQSQNKQTNISVLPIEGATCLNKLSCKFLYDVPGLFCPNDSFDEQKAPNNGLVHFFSPIWLVLEGQGQTLRFVSDWEIEKDWFAVGLCSYLLLHFALFSSWC